MDLLFIILSFLIGSAFGGFILFFKSKAEKAALESRLEITMEESNRNQAIIAEIQQKNQDLGNDLAGADRDIAHLQEKLQTERENLFEMQKTMQLQFEQLAQKVLHENSQRFSEQNKESIKVILDPLKEKISDFEKKVETTNKDSISMHASLREQIFGLKELNEQMSKEALNLTKALKGDSKKQGNWGELVLERVLEKSGLEKGREFDVQQSFQREDGSRVLPDVIIHLPDGKKMIVDSKVSLTAYEQYVNAEDEDIQQRYLKAHIESIKKHVDGLSGQNYHDLYQIESPDFVLMFVPIESAFAIALGQDESLYTKAFDKNIVIVTPTTLLATLSTIESMWKNDKQQKNAVKIAQEAGSLYDKFEGLMQDLVKVGKRIQDTESEYKSAMNKLFEGNGNIIRKVENLKKLGAKANKSLPENLLDRADD
jgi:DNA recombination protein RmuC